MVCYILLQHRWRISTVFLLKQRRIKYHASSFFSWTSLKELFLKLYILKGFYCIFITFTLFIMVISKVLGRFFFLLLMQLVSLSYLLQINCKTWNRDFKIQITKTIFRMTVSNYSIQILSKSYYSFSTHKACVIDITFSY